MLNDTMGPEGIAPQILVFGTIPNFKSSEGNHRGPDKRMDFIRTAKAEMERIYGERRLKKELKERLKPATR